MSWPCGVPQFCLLKVRCMVELGKKIDFYCNVVAHRSSDEMEKGMGSGESFPFLCCILYVPHESMYAVVSDSMSSH